MICRAGRRSYARAAAALGGSGLDWIDLEEPAERGGVLPCPHVDCGDRGGVLVELAVPAHEREVRVRRGGVQDRVVRGGGGAGVAGGGVDGLPNGSNASRDPTRASASSDCEITSACSFG